MRDAAHSADFGLSKGTNQLCGRLVPRSRLQWPSDCIAYRPVPPPPSAPTSFIPSSGILNQRSLGQPLHHPHVQCSTELPILGLAELQRSGPGSETVFAWGLLGRTCGAVQSIAWRRCWFLSWLPSSSLITSVANPASLPLWIPEPTTATPSLIQNAFCERAHTASWSNCDSYHCRLQWPSAPARDHGRPRRAARLAEPGRGGSGHSKELRRTAARRWHCARLMHARECWHPKRLVSGPFFSSLYVNTQSRTPLVTRLSRH